MEYGIVVVPAAPVRRKPNHRSEMVNQLLFGESVKILKTKGELWIKVRSLHDGYEGWTTHTLLEETDELIASTPCVYVTKDMLNSISADNYNTNVPVGSSLTFFETFPDGKMGGKGKLAGKDYHFTGHFSKRDDQTVSAETVQHLSMKWLNAPYLWGGRTPMGVDCSGFVQVIFKQMGFDLPRDAWQQAQEGRGVKKFRDARPGDLAFFDNKEDIVHVGILLGNEQIIHASGKVRIDTIDKKGIIHAVTGKRGLQLKAIRRLW